MSAAEIARALHGNRNGTGFVCRCPVPSHGKGNGDSHPSLSIADGEKDVILKCFAGCDSLDVLAELRRRGLLDDRLFTGQTVFRRRDTEKVRERFVEHEPDEKAVASWRAAVPAQETAAEEYLRARGISIDVPPSLRFF